MNLFLNAIPEHVISTVLSIPLFTVYFMPRILSQISMLVKVCRDRFVIFILDSPSASPIYVIIWSARWLSTGDFFLSSFIMHSAASSPTLSAVLSILPRLSAPRIAPDFNSAKSTMPQPRSNAHFRSYGFNDSKSILTSL